MIFWPIFKNSCLKFMFFFSLNSLSVLFNIYSKTYPKIGDVFFFRLSTIFKILYRVFNAVMPIACDASRRKFLFWQLKRHESWSEVFCSFFFYFLCLKWHLNAFQWEFYLIKVTVTQQTMVKRKFFKIFHLRYLHSSTSH